MAVLKARQSTRISLKQGKGGSTPRHCPRAYNLDVNAKANLQLLLTLRVRVPAIKTASPFRTRIFFCRAVLQSSRDAADRSLQILSQIISIGDHAHLQNAVFLARKRIVKASLGQLDLMVSSLHLWIGPEGSHRGPEQQDQLEGRRQSNNTCAHSSFESHLWQGCGDSRLEVKWRKRRTDLGGAQGQGTGMARCLGLRSQETLREDGEPPSSYKFIPGPQYEQQGAHVLERGAGTGARAAWLRISWDVRRRVPSNPEGICGHKLQHTPLCENFQVSAFATGLWSRYEAPAPSVYTYADVFKDPSRLLRRVRNRCFRRALCFDSEAFRPELGLRRAKDGEMKTLTMDPAEGQGTQATNLGAKKVAVHWRISLSVRLPVPFFSFRTHRHLQGVAYTSMGMVGTLTLPGGDASFADAEGPLRASARQGFSVSVVWLAPGLHPGNSRPRFRSRGRTSCDWMLEVINGHCEDGQGLESIFAIMTNHQGSGSDERGEAAVRERREGRRRETTDREPSEREEANNKRHQNIKTCREALVLTSSRRGGYDGHERMVTLWTTQSGI
ncbi:hypothetical protein M419DRAFT_79973 [Trichoderma reesei RUT C-30]|uniref:Uncharacterized protein n=1 Tax=Hypocrea jecorina (strain ATCC 56765 / BCRC 32924 / NRRL 11460 / Rut C-30) TaxID=1344414 RepID=A0A024S9G7_HYPJR|nr:hypothetical protein M419DRAFT_79973 [Trichoderma reesei RUT C-30]